MNAVPIPRPNLRRAVSIFFIVLGLSLLVGFWGYRYFAGLGSIDAFLNASMILSGMGPVGVIRPDSGKIFAGCYALFSGVFILAVLAYIIDGVVASRV